MYQIYHPLHKAAPRRPSLCLFQRELPAVLLPFDVHALHLKGEIPVIHEGIMLVIDIHAAYYKVGRPRREEAVVTHYGLAVVEAGLIQKHPHAAFQGLFHVILVKEVAHAYVHVLGNEYPNVHPSLIGLKGEGQLATANEQSPFAAGETILIPAKNRVINVSGKMKFLEVHIDNQKIQIDE